MRDPTTTASSPIALTNPGTVASMSAFHELEMTSITGDQVAFDQFRGQMCLVVNVASA